MLLAPNYDDVGPTSEGVVNHSVRSSDTNDHCFRHVGLSWWVHRFAFAPAKRPSDADRSDVSATSSSSCRPEWRIPPELHHRRGQVSDFQTAERATDALKTASCYLVQLSLSEGEA